MIRICLAYFDASGAVIAAACVNANSAQQADVNAAALPCWPDDAKSAVAVLSATQSLAIAAKP